MIDINKKYRTRAGAEVRIYALDGEEPRPVHGAIKSPTGWVVSHWPQDGVQSDFEGSNDLVEVKPRIKRTVWLNVYTGGVSIWMHSSKEEADLHAEPKRHACVKVEIDCEEGEGL
jgi:hypothetical protein